MRSLGNPAQVPEDNEQTPFDNHTAGASNDYFVARLRIKELRRIFHFRWGHTLPDDDSGLHDAEIILAHIAQAGGDVETKIDNFLDIWCPWMPPSLRADAKLAAMTTRRRWTADGLAAEMNLTLQERSDLKIKTIGAVDCNEQARISRRQEKHRKRQQERRRKLRLQPKRQAKVPVRRLQAILLLLPAAGWSSVPRLCRELANHTEFAHQMSMRSAVHRAIDKGVADGVLESRMRANTGGLPEREVARKGRVRC